MTHLWKEWKRLSKSGALSKHLWFSMLLTCSKIPCDNCFRWKITTETHERTLFIYSYSLFVHYNHHHNHFWHKILVAITKCFLAFHIPLISITFNCEENLLVIQYLVHFVDLHFFLANNSLLFYYRPFANVYVKLPYILNLTAHSPQKETDCSFDLLKMKKCIPGRESYLDRFFSGSSSDSLLTAVKINPFKSLDKSAKDYQSGNQHQNVFFVGSASFPDI